MLTMNISGPTTVIRRLALSVFALVLASGCLPLRDECGQDSDCGQGACTRTGECVASGDLVSARIFWTLNGQPPDQATCASVDELSVSFLDDQTENNTSFRPITCTLGQILFDRMAGRFDRIRLSAHGRRGEILDSAIGSLDAAVNEFSFDLVFDVRL